MKSNYTKYAILIGSSLLLMALLAGYAYGYIYSGFMTDDSNNFINGSMGHAKKLYNSGITAWLIILILDLFVSWGLYKYFNRVNKTLSALSSGLRIIYTLILAIGIFYLFQQVSVFSSNFSASEKMFLIRAAYQSFDKYWSLGLIIFGFHLVIWGILNWIAHFIPKYWSILFIIAGFSYSFIHIVKSFVLLTPDMINSIEQILMFPMTIAEVGFAIWLLIKR